MCYPQPQIKFINYKINGIRPQIKPGQVVKKRLVTKQERYGLQYMDEIKDNT